MNYSQRKTAFRRLSKFAQSAHFYTLEPVVPRAGLEPAQPYSRGILNPLCLPISPPGQILFITNITVTVILLLSYPIRVNLETDSRLSGYSTLHNVLIITIFGAQGGT